MGKRKDLAMRRRIIFAMGVFSLACLTQTLASPVPVVEVSTELPGTPYTIPACEPAGGVTFEVRNLAYQETSAELIAGGLTPGETPYVYYNTPPGDLPGTGGAYPGNVVDSDGRFFFQLEHLEPPNGQTSATWDIRLVHRRGVECATVTLP
jgi:hypothetical protein